MACLLRFAGRRSVPVLFAVRSFSAAPASASASANAAEAAAGISTSLTSDGVLVIRLDTPGEKVRAKHDYQSSAGRTVRADRVS